MANHQDCAGTASADHGGPFPLQFTWLSGQEDAGCLMELEFRSVYFISVFLVEHKHIFVTFFQSFSLHPNVNAFVDLDLLSCKEMHCLRIFLYSYCLNLNAADRTISMKQLV